MHATRSSGFSHPIRATKASARSNSGPAPVLPADACVRRALRLARLARARRPMGSVRAIAFAVWATYPALALFGLLHPLRWLPLMFFTIGYKAIWMAFVAYPLWQAGTLWGTPTGELAGSFLGMPLLAAVVPWGYAWRTYFGWARRAGLKS